MMPVKARIASKTKDIPIFVWEILTLLIKWLEKRIAVTTVMAKRVIT